MTHFATAAGRHRHAADALDLVAALALAALALSAVALPQMWPAGLPGGGVGYTSPWAPLLVLGQTLPVAARRRAPRAVLAVTVVSTLAYRLLGLEPFADFLGVLVAFYTVASQLPVARSRVPCLLTVLVVPLVYVSSAEAVELYWWARHVLVCVLVWLLGVERRRALEDRAWAAAEREERRAAQEREGVARQLHDVLARTITVMVVQAEALKARGELPGQADARVDALLGAGRRALAEVRATLAGLHRPERDAAPDWASAVASFRSAGLVVVQTHRSWECLVLDRSGTGVRECAWRVVHEGLANALRHAGPGTTAQVSAARSGAWLEVAVTDDGSGSPPTGEPDGGFGLPSLERDVARLGGSLCWGPRRGPGWRLEARLPVGEAS